jgi:hypothetical protein
MPEQELAHDDVRRAAYPGVGAEWREGLVRP